MKFQGVDVRRAMVVYAHPDDAEFGLAGTVAKWAKAGVEITYCMITNGASGSDDPKISRKRLREIRYAEQRAAAKILGVKNCVFLGYEDGYLYPTLEARRDVARQIRIHRPDVLITMDPTTRVAADFYVNHPDHIAAGEIALRSINPDASTRQMFPELWKKEHLEPHKPRILMLEAFGGAGTVIDISDVLELKVKALLAHTSQIWPEAEAMVREFAKRTGKAAGYKAGESFRIVHLERGEDEGIQPKPRRGTAARRRKRTGGTLPMAHARSSPRRRSGGRSAR